MVVSLNTEPELETSDARFVKVTNHKYRTELKRLTQRLEHFEKERKEREKSEQDADQDEAQGSTDRKVDPRKPRDPVPDEAIDLANKKPRIEEPSNFDQPSTSKMQ